MFESVACEATIIALRELRRTTATRREAVAIDGAANAVRDRWDTTSAHRKAAEAVAR
jgi:hypothetical protein